MHLYIFACIFASKFSHVTLKYNITHRCPRNRHLRHPTISPIAHPPYTTRSPYPTHPKRMQRPGYPPTAASPPLHHPVPQHVSTIPMMRSPPPPPGSASGYSNYGGSQNSHVPQPGTTPIHPAYGGFFNDNTAQMGFQVGRTAYMAGQEYVEQNVRFCC